MKKTSTVRVNGNMIFKGHKLTIGLDLGDRWPCYCVLDEAGEILLEQKVATTPEAMKDQGTRPFILHSRAERPFVLLFVARRQERTKSSLKWLYGGSINVFIRRTENRSALQGFRRVGLAKGGIEHWRHRYP
jgi:hypothetical protein